MDASRDSVNAPRRRKGASCVDGVALDARNMQNSGEVRPGSLVSLFGSTVEFAKICCQANFVVCIPPTLSEESVQATLRYLCVIYVADTTAMCQ